MKKIILKLIRFYRTYISPNKPPSCRFTPTCSQYAYEAVEKYGAAKGSYKAVKRVLRCHPYYKGNLYDPVD